MPEVWSRENSATPFGGSKEEKQSENHKHANSGWSHLGTALRERERERVPFFHVSPSMTQPEPPLS